MRASSSTGEARLGSVGRSCGVARMSVVQMQWYVLIADFSESVAAIEWFGIAV